MTEEFRRVLPVVVQSVHVGDRHLRKLLIRDIRKTHDIDTDHFSHRRFISDAKGAHAAVLAEVVMVLARVEYIFREFSLACQQAEFIRFRNGRPEARTSADRAVAAERALCRSISASKVMAPQWQLPW